MLPLTVNAEGPDKTNQTVGQENITTRNTEEVKGIFIPSTIRRLLTYSYDEAGNRIKRAPLSLDLNNEAKFPDDNVKPDFPLVPNDAADNDFNDSND